MNDTQFKTSLQIADKEYTYFSLIDIASHLISLCQNYPIQYVYF